MAGVFEFDNKTKGKLKKIDTRLYEATAYLRGFGMGGSYTGTPTSAEITGDSTEDSYYVRNLKMVLPDVKKIKDSVEIIFTPDILDQLDPESMDRYLRMMKGFETLIDFLGGKTKGNIVQVVSDCVEDDISMGCLRWFAY